MIQNLITSLLLSSAIGLGANNVKYNNTIEKPHEILNVTFDDDSKTVTFNVNELNNCKFYAFYNEWQTVDLTNFSDTTIVYNNENFHLDDIDNNGAFFTQNSAVGYTWDILFKCDNVYEYIYFELSYSGDEEEYIFEYDLTWDLFETSQIIYTQVKNALLNDIENYNLNTIKFDDSLNEIYFSADVLNNWTFNNLAYTLNTNPDIDLFGSYFTNLLESLSYNMDDYIPFDYLVYVHNKYFVSFILTDTYKFTYEYNDGESQYFEYDFNYYLIWDLDDTYTYQQIKTALLKDIKANTDSKYMNPLVEIISIITGGIGAFAANLGTGVSTYVGALFINNGTLSVFGAVVSIFAGIALAVGLSRLIFNWIISLGGKK